MWEAETHELAVPCLLFHAEISVAAVGVGAESSEVACVDAWLHAHAVAAVVAPGQCLNMSTGFQ